MHVLVLMVTIPSVDLDRASLGHLEDEEHVYTYDANGNQTSRTVKDAVGDPTGERFVFTWNADNQLIKAERFAAAADADPAMTTEYVYDGLGRRIAKIVDGVTTEFVYDR